MGVSLQGSGQIRPDDKNIQDAKTFDEARGETSTGHISRQRRVTWT